MAKIINSMAQLKKLIDDSEYAVYARWSRGFAKDSKQGASRDYLSGETHAGLSAAEVNPAWLSDDAYLARRVTEYIFLRTKDEKIGCHLYEGVECGKDSDGYPSITKIEHVATLSNAFVEKLMAMRGI